jgi:hypothetical protein
MNDFRRSDFSQQILFHNVHERQQTLVLFKLHLSGEQSVLFEKLPRRQNGTADAAPESADECFKKQKVRGKPSGRRELECRKLFQIITHAL